MIALIAVDSQILIPRSRAINSRPSVSRSKTSYGTNAKIPQIAPFRYGRWVGPAVLRERGCTEGMKRLAPSGQFQQVRTGKQRFFTIHRYQMFIRRRDRTRVSVEIEQSDRKHITERFPKADVPVDLIKQAIPGKSYDRHAVLTDQPNIMPLPPEPVRSFICIGRVCFGVHYQPVISSEILHRNYIPAKKLAEAFNISIAVDQFFVPLVVIKSQDGRVCRSFAS